MAQRITWQNVAAPDFSDAAIANRTAGEQISKAFERLGSGLGALDYRNRTKDSQAAMAEALKISDLSAWNAAMAGPGVEGFGVDPTRATPDFMRFLEGRQRDLGASATNAFNLERSKLNAARTDKQNALTDAAAARDLEAMGIADKIARSNYSPEEAERIALNQTQHDPQLQRAVLKNLSAQPGGRYSAPDSVELSDPITQALQDGRANLKSAQGTLEDQYRSHKGLDVFDTAQQRFTGGDAFKTLISSLGEYSGAKVGEDGEGGFADSTGEIRDAYDKLRGGFTKEEVSDAEIAAALDKHIQATGLGWLGNDELTFNTDDAYADLEAIRDNRNGLRDIQIENGNQRETIAKFDKKLMTAENNLRLARARNDGSKSSLDEIEKRKADLLSAKSELSKALAPRKPPATTANTPPAKALTFNRGGGSLLPPLSNQDRIPSFDAGSGSLLPPGQSDADPRASAINDASSWAGTAIQGLNRQAAETLFPSRLAEGLVNFPNRLTQGMDYVNAAGAAMIDPALGSERFQKADADYAATQQPAAPTPAAPQAPAEQILQQARTSPGETIETIVAETNLPGQTAEVAKQAVEMLRTGQTPDGKPLSKAQRAEVQEQLLVILDRAGQSQAAKDGPIRQLLESPEAWLGIR